MSRQGQITLRPLSPADIAEIKRWPNYSEEFQSLDYALRSGGWLDAFPESATTRRFGGWLSGTLVGFSLLTDITASRAEFYIALHPSQTGRGIGRQLTEQTMSYAFTTLKLRKVYLKVRKWHSRAIELYERVGFVVAGEKEESIQGQFVEFHVMEMEHPAAETSPGTLSIS